MSHLVNTTFLLCWFYFVLYLIYSPLTNSQATDVDMKLSWSCSKSKIWLGPRGLTIPREKELKVLWREQYYTEVQKKKGGEVMWVGKMLFLCWIKSQCVATECQTVLHKAGSRGCEISLKYKAQMHSSHTPTHAFIHTQSKGRWITDWMGSDVTHSGSRSHGGDRSSGK